MAMVEIAEHEVDALIRALLEAKFSGNAIDADVPESRLVAAIALRAVSCRLRDEPSSKKWYCIDPSRREWRAALLHAVRRRDWWERASFSSREEFARSLLAPFVVDGAVVEEFVRAVESVIVEAKWVSIWLRCRDGDVDFATLRSVPETGDCRVVGSDGQSVLQSGGEAALHDWLQEAGYEFMAYHLVL